MIQNNTYHCYLFSGCSVIISPRDGSESSLLGVIHAVDACAGSLTVCLRSIEQDLNAQLSYDFTIREVDIIDRIINGIEGCFDNGEDIASVLFNEKDVSQPLAELDAKILTAEGNINFYNGDLDPSQKAAVEFVLRQPHVSIIHGPPGTGKSTTLVEVVRQHVRMGVKVLVLAPSNIAVDVMTLKLQEAGLTVVRIGNTACTAPELKWLTIESWVEEMDITTERLFAGIDVVLTTITSSTHSVMDSLPYDHFGLTVIDECGQATEASCYMPLDYTSKLVLAGDHMQLPPTVISTKATGLLSSLMERLISNYGDKIYRLLTVQYRMHRDIMDWSSRNMYQGKLTAHPSVENRRLCDLAAVTRETLTETVLLLIKTSNDDDYHEKSSASFGSDSRFNIGEANAVLQQVIKLVDAGVSEEEIAVATPYTGQVRFITDLLSAEGYSAVDVKTVDGFQGGEKEAIIISMVRSNSKGNIGFLGDQRRMNVAFTRARRHLCVICNPRTVSSAPFLRDMLSYMDERGSVIDLKSGYSSLQSQDVASSAEYTPARKRSKKK